MPMLDWWIGKKKKKRWPDYYRRYYDRTLQKVPLRTSLDELRIIVLDTETTGFDYTQDRILSIGAVELRGLSILTQKQLNCFVHQPAALHNREAIAVHGILPSSHPDSYTEEEAMQRLLAYLDRDLIVAHHANFDRQMIDATLDRLGAGPLRNPIVDTVNLAKRVMPPTHYVPEERYSLDQLAEQYRIELQDRHTALGDAYITALLFLKLVTKLKGKGQFTLGDLLRRPRQYYR
jgi:DNA polymerase-3 subunit epsilon